MPLSSRQPAGTGQRPPAPQITTVVFLVVILAVAAIATGGYLAKRDSASANREMTMQPDAPVATDVPGTSDQPPGDTRQRRAVAAPDSDAPAVTAQAVFAYDPASGEVLFSKNPDEEREIGSTVKIMTALVVLDYVPLDTEITIQEDDLVDQLVYSNMQLVAGDTLTVEQLLYGLLIPSGSDGARALARYVGGLIDPGADDPRQVFTGAMNQRAANMGMDHTRFANADGNDTSDSHSSARDIAIAAAALLESPVLADIVGQTGYTFTSVGPEAREYSGVTTNKLLQDGYAGVIGVKTGSTEDAGGCVVLAQQESGRTIIVAVLGADLTYENDWIATDARWDDATALLEYLDR
jgi:D-alanyl-D-alanine carboxypeptidase (penicillin-binding protein 5/6)